MKKSLTVTLLGAIGAAFLATSAHADSTTFRGHARVVSVTPVMTQVRVVAPPDCYTGRLQPQSNPTGAVVGAVLGGVVGSRFGGGSGRDVATALGVVSGAVIGNNMGSSSGSAQEVCESRVYYEARPDGYDVVYDIGGYQGTVRTAEFPGRDIPVEVRVTPLMPVYHPSR